MKKIFTLAIFSLVAAVLIAPIISLGAVADPNADDTKVYPVLDIPKFVGGEGAVGGNADCFDYYTFQSARVLFGAPKENFVPGEKISFKGSLVNENDYPIVDGYVFARVTQVNSGSVVDGNFIVDEFFALEKVSLDAKETKSAKFDWVVPQTAVKGKYKIDYFFSVGKKFNLGGLPFSNEVIAGFTSFNVAATNTTAVSFNRSETKVNGVKYFHIGNWPVFEKGEKVTIAQPIKNTTNKSKKVDVTYDLYFWDSLNSTDKISTKTELVDVAAGASKTLSYVIDQMNDSVYMLKITAVSEGQKSIVNIRVTSDQEHARLNYPAITKFPLEKNNKFTLFSCYHNSSALDTTGKVVVTLSDKNGKEVGKLNYSGTIPSAMSATKQDLVAADKYTYLKLTADVFNKDGVKIESYETVYDCSTLKSTKCKQMENLVVAPEPIKSSIFLSPLVMGLVALLIVLIVVIFIISKKNKKTDIINPLILFIVVALSVFSFGAKNAAAIYEERNPTTSGKYNQFWFNYCSEGKGEDDVRRVAASDITVTHTIGLTEGSSNMKTGDKVSFDYGTSPVLFFNVSDVAWDTPYGSWCSEWNSPCFKTGSDNQLESLKKGVSAGTTYKGYDWWGSDKNKPYWITWTGVKPTDFTLTSSNNGVISCSGKTCTSVAPGKATITATIPRTTITPWLYITFDEESGWLFNPDRGSDYGHRLCGGDDRICTGDCYVGGNKNSASLPEATATWDVSVLSNATCNNGVVEAAGGEECDDGPTGNGVCPKACSSGCQLNECPCIGSSCGGGGIGSSCTNSTSCQSGLCCSEDKICSANCEGSVCSPACAVGKTCCGNNSCRTDCTCLVDPGVGQKCCADGIIREVCQGESCSRDGQCGAGECCNKENNTCSTNSQYCGNLDFSIDAIDDIKIYLTGNQVDHSGSTRVKVSPAGGFSKDITFSPVSVSPTDLWSKIKNLYNMFTSGGVLVSSKYDQGLILTVSVPYNVLEPSMATSKTYQMTIKAAAEGIEAKTKNVMVKIYGQDWVQP